MNREEWMQHIETLTGVLLGGLVTMAQRDGCPLEMWPTMVKVGTALADQAEDAMAAGASPDPFSACPKCLQAGGVMVQRPNATTELRTCTSCNHRWETEPPRPDGEL